MTARYVRDESGLYISKPGFDVFTYINDLDKFLVHPLLVTLSRPFVIDYATGTWFKSGNPDEASSGGILGNIYFYVVNHNFGYHPSFRVDMLAPVMMDGQYGGTSILTWWMTATQFIFRRGFSEVSTGLPATKTFSPAPKYIIYELPLK